MSSESDYYQDGADDYEMLSELNLSHGLMTGLCALGCDAIANCVSREDAEEYVRGFQDAFQKNNPDAEGTESR